MSAVVFLNSAYEGVPRAFDALIVAGRIRVVEDEQLTTLAPHGVGGLVITSHVDQIWLSRQSVWLASFLNAGGRLFFNGHVEMPFLAGLERYQPLLDRSIAAFRVTPVHPHPIWQGYSSDDLTARKGVVGFYGRGQNPPPPGAVAVNVLDVDKEHSAVDWEWVRPQGGYVISHAGNDLWTTFEDATRNTEIVTRMVSWLEGRL